jgi:hypothetical protein
MEQPSIQKKTAEFLGGAVLGFLLAFLGWFLSCYIVEGGYNNPLTASVGSLLAAALLLAGFIFKKIRRRVFIGAALFLAAVILIPNSCSIYHLLGK